VNSRRTTLIVAVVLAIGTGWLTLNYLSSIQRSSAANSEPRQVLVAAQEIPARAPITAAMLARVMKPAAAIDPDAIVDPNQVIGALSLITIPAGATITASKVGHPSDVGLPVRLTPGMRAVSIPIDRVKGISGLVQPGDRVDVIAIPPKLGAQPPPAATILRGVRVLAIGSLMEYTSATPGPQEANSTTITLELTPKQVDLIDMADLNSVLRLALRSPREPINSYPVEALDFQTPIPAPAAGPVLAQAPAKASSAEARPASSGVMIIDGDRVTGSNP